MRIFRPLRSSTVLISLRNQPPICVPVLPISEAFRIEGGAEFIDQLLAVAVIVPGVLLTGIQTERKSAKQRPGRVLADIIILRAVTHLDRAVLNGVERLQRRHDFAAGENLDLEFAVGRVGDKFREGQAGAEQRIERLRPARGQTPLQFRHRLGDGGHGNRGARGAHTGNFQEFTTFHGVFPPSWSCWNDHRDNPTRSSDWTCRQS